VSDIATNGRGVISKGNGPTKSAENDDIGRFTGKTTHPPSKTAESLTKVGDRLPSRLLASPYPTRQKIFNT